MMLKAMFAGLVLVLGACAAPEPVGSNGSKPKVGAQADSQLLAPPPVVQTLSDPPAAASPQTEAAACAAKGGTVQRVCLLGNPMCVVPYADAGKACTSRSQCGGRCLGDGKTPADQPATGKCAASNQPCGCFQTVENGLAQPMMCVD